MAEAYYEGEDPYIFVSYSHRDSEAALPIIESLRHAGYRVWYDAGIKPGAEWVEYIASHVSSCRCVLALVTSSLVASSHCRREMYYALSQGKDMLLVYLEDVELTQGMQMYYSPIQAVKRSDYSSHDDFISRLLRVDVLKPCLFSDAARRKDTRQQAVEELTQMAESLLGRYDTREDSLRIALLSLRALPAADRDTETEWLIGRLMERISWLEFERERDMREAPALGTAEKVQEADSNLALEASESSSAPSPTKEPTTTENDEPRVDESHPRVFISYSQTSDEYRKEVVDLAACLINDGVDVVIDEWDLKPGQDRFAFMQRCVTDGTIEKVLVLCDRSYAKEADSRRGRAGDETSIITPEVYRSAEQTKFVPVLMERDSNGEGFLPAYLGSRECIDLSDRAHKKQYERLLRHIYGVPRQPKPKLGSYPTWLNDGEREQKEQNSRVRAGTKAVEVQGVRGAGLMDAVPQKSFSEYSWMELKRIANEIAAARSDSAGLEIAKYCNLVGADGKLGDERIPVTLTDGGKAEVRIAGFRHDELADGVGKAGITFEFASIHDTHVMNSSRTNEGGWEGSEMHKFLNESFLELLPEELRSNIAAVNKLTNNRGGDVQNDTSVVSATKDKLWLLSMIEVYGTLSDQPKYVPEYPAVYDAEGAQYQLYADQGVTTSNYRYCVKKKEDGARSWWWLRSPGAVYSNGFHYVSPGGDWCGCNAGAAWGVSPGFCF